MALFMGYTIVLSAVILLVCHLADFCVASYRRPTRFVWVGGILLAAGLPISAFIGNKSGEAPSPTAVSSNARHEVVTSSQPVLSRSSTRLTPSISDRLRPLDGALVDLWIIATFTSLIGILVFAVRSRRMISQSDFAELQGVRIRQTRDIGPALVGFINYEIVLPLWVCDLPTAQQQLIIAHEQEHRSARDPLLIWACVFLLVLFPWNVSLWYLMRSLRTSIEIDCDRRVLTSTRDAATYGSLLLDVCARVANKPSFAAALGESRSQLHRRIRAMSLGPRRFERTRIIASVLAACSLLVAATRVHSPKPDALRSTFAMRTSDKTVSPASVAPIARNIATVAVETESGARDALLVFTTKAGRVGLHGDSPQLITDTLRLQSPVTLSADLTEGEVHIVSANGSVLHVTAVFLNSPAIRASADFSHVILKQGGVGVGRPKPVAGQYPSSDWFVPGVGDSVVKLARILEPAAFDKKASPNSSLIGLLFDETGTLVHHSRVTVPDSLANWRIFTPKLFPNAKQADNAPYQVMSFADGRNNERNVGVFAVFLKRPTSWAKSAEGRTSGQKY